MVKNLDNILNTENFETDINGYLELFCEYGGGNKKFHLYARNKEIGALIYIGTLENTTDKIKLLHNRNKLAAESIINEEYNLLEGIDKIKNYVLRPLGWTDTIRGEIPHK